MTVIRTSYTYGFEAEFSTPADNIVSVLHDKELMGMDTMHNYTCDCEYCVVSYMLGDGTESYDHEEIWPLRAKNDSSCGGEVISKVFSNIDEAIDVFKSIEDAALQTDTEPGLQAGFHVHVGRGHLNKIQRGRLVFAMTLWEPVLFDIAAGRWPHNRGWNTSLVSLMDYFYSNQAASYGIDNSIVVGPTLLKRIHEYLDGSSLDNDFYRNLADYHRHVDRHSSMAFSSRWPTMEFRLWNSTRAAWRMELWCRLSRILTNPVFVDMLIEQWTLSATMDSFLNVFDGITNHRRLEELLQRQISYVRRLHTEGIGQHAMQPFSFA